jgi:hypothetical protein
MREFFVCVSSALSALTIVFIGCVAMVALDRTRAESLRMGIVEFDFSGLADQRIALPRPPVPLIEENSVVERLRARAIAQSCTTVCQKDFLGRQVCTTHCY